jgi:Carbohydrate binding domain (family 11)
MIAPVASTRAPLVLVSLLAGSACYSPTLHGATGGGMTTSGAVDGGSSGAPMPIDSSGEDPGEGSLEGEGTAMDSDAATAAHESSEGAAATSSTGEPSGTSEDASGTTADEATGGEVEVAIAPGDMIDDFEDGDGIELASDGRVGGWFAYNDGSADGIQVPALGTPLEPSAGGPPGSTLCATTNGDGFTAWGAGIGIDVHHPWRDPLPSSYDASAFAGIAFWARGDTALRVRLVDAATAEVAFGGACEIGCNDSHGATFLLDDQWRQYVLPFADATQEGWGTAVAFDPAGLIGVSFQTPAGSAFALSIDELGFYVPQ